MPIQEKVEAKRIEARLEEGNAGPLGRLTPTAVGFSDGSSDAAFGRDGFHIGADRGSYKVWSLDRGAIASAKVEGDALLAQGRSIPELHGGDPAPGSASAKGGALFGRGSEVVWLEADYVVEIDRERGRYREHDGASLGTPSAWSPLPAAIADFELVTLRGNQCLFWHPPTGRYELRNYGLGRFSTPLTTGEWSSIRQGHTLVYLGNERVLDHDKNEGTFRVWKLDRNYGSPDPLPTKVGSGSWPRASHDRELIGIGDGAVLDWEPATGTVKVWLEDRSSTAADHDPFPRAALSHRWKTIREGHRVVYNGGNRLLDWTEPRDFVSFDTNSGALHVRAPDGSTGVLIDGGSGDIVLANGDCAEDFTVELPEEVQPGMVVVIGDDEKLRPCRTEYDRTVAGVIAGAGTAKPGVILGRTHHAADRMPLALVGRVFVWVDATETPVRRGDLLTTSATAGHAQCVDDFGRAPGAILGKALRGLESGRGLVPILVALQ